MELYGWDTVFLLREDNINKILIENYDSLLQTFSVQLPGGDLAIGRFGPWELTKGGSHEIIYLVLPIEEGYLERGSEKINLAGLKLVVATWLDWLNLDNEQKKVLKFDYQRLGEPNNPPNKGELSVIALHDPYRIISPSDNAILSFGLGKYLVENADKVRFVFASVNMQPDSVNPWLSPKKSAYAYLKAENAEYSYLAIFNSTTDREIDNLEKKVDEKAFAQNFGAIYLISEELYMINAIAPSLGKAFNVSASEFIYDSHNKLLKNTLKLRCKDIKSGLIYYTPYLHVLEIRSGGERLEARYQGNVDMYAGIMLDFTIDTKNPATYNQTNGVLEFLPDQHPVESHHANIPWWFYFTGVIVIVIVEIVVKVLSDSLINELSNENKERFSWGKNPPSSIQWGESSPFKVATAGLNGAMYLMGDIIIKAQKEEEVLQSEETM